MTKEKNITSFNKDVESNKGYLYTTNETLSNKFAAGRVSEAIHLSVNLNGKSVIDIGCGDGKYTFEFLKFNPSYVLGVEPADKAISIAKSKIEGQKNIDFQVCDIYNLSPLKKHFDIAIIRGVLHHLYEVELAVKNVCQIADEIIVVEPNGYNFILKIIEKTSFYHIEHEEKSYFPHKLNKWFSQNGGKITGSSYIGLVPIFCPDYVAKILKKIEPLVEKIFPFNMLFCAQYVVKIKINGNKNII